mmetsp:Transcript_21533/g.19100  ORF Transcript_21533/g.19100 Transcript_21533/m.19100 type:complete len:295 (+) Transcript_21533:106-990(+)
MLATSVLFFVISGIQFWASDYMRLVLKIPEEIVFPAFSIITLTGPTIGCIVGGGMTHLLGGYDHPNALKLVLYVGFIGTIVSLPIPFIEHTPTFLILFWLSLFAGGFIMPGATGIMINSAPKKHRALANSIAFVSYNLIGYVPGPVVYGVLTHFYGDKSRVGMFALIWALILCVGFVYLAYRNSPKVVEQGTKVAPVLKTYAESVSESDPGETKRFNRRQNRLLRLSHGNLDWALQSKAVLGNSYLEDFIPSHAQNSPRGKRRESIGYIFISITNLNYLQFQKILKQFRLSKPK